MPEFHIDLGDMPSTYAALDQFTQGYIEAAFFTESGESDSPCEGKSFSDLAPVTLTSMIEDCHDFQQACGADIAEACDQDKVNYDEHRAGCDFWFTRNGHGCGFWDRGLQDIGDKLTQAAKGFRGCDLYQGDDGLIYGA
jgi:hypothetical protein